MADNAQHPVNGWAAAVEPHAVASWPARETMTRDGWLLRFTDGFSSRANSVSTLSFSGGSLVDAVAAAEGAYRARDLPPVFQLTPASRPDGLEALLLARGYAHRSPTIVMVGEAGAIARQEAVSAGADPDRAFVHLTREGSHSQADGGERLDTLARAPLPKAFFVADGIACGACVATGGWAGVYVMRTAAAARRQGHGSRVLRAIAAWAREQGAAQLYLQVDAANIAARALYARAGFRDAYRVLHYAAPEPDR